MHTLPYLYVFPAPLKVLPTLPVNDQLATPSILLHWYLLKVPLHPQLNSLHSLQRVFAPDHLLSALQVNDQHRGYSILAQSRELIVPTAQQLEPMEGKQWGNNLVVFIGAISRNGGPSKCLLILFLLLVFICRRVAARVDGGYKWCWDDTVSRVCNAWGIT